MTPARGTKTAEELCLGADSQFSNFTGIMNRNGRAVDQVACGYQDIVDQQGVCSGDKEIGMRHTATKGGWSNSDRAHILDPCLRIALPEPIAADPLDGAYPPKDGRQQIPNPEVFNLSIAVCGPDRCSS
jgi:hypothetical protein